MTAFDHTGRPLSPLTGKVADRASETLARMQDCIALGTCHAPRLCTLSERLSKHIDHRDEGLLSWWLAEYGKEIDGECRAAERSTIKARKAA